MPALAPGGHLAAQLFARLDLVSARFSRDPGRQSDFPAIADDLVNTAFGFAPARLPFTTTLLLGLQSLATPQAEQRLGRNVLVFSVAGALVPYALIAIFYYSVRSFAVVHKVSYMPAGSAPAAAFVCITLLAKYLP